MRKLRNSKSNQLYSKVLLYIIFSIVLTTLILSTILYVNFENIISSMIDDYNRDSLTQVSSSSSFMVSSAKTVALQAYFDNDISHLLYYSAKEVVSNPSTQYAALNRLVSYRNVTPLIQSIYVYNASPSGGIYTSFGTMETNPSHFFDKQIYNILNNARTYKKNTFIPRRVPNILKDSSHSAYCNVYTYLFFDAPIDNSSPSEAIILNLSEEWLRDTMNSINSTPQSDTFIVDSKGRTIISCKKYKMFSNLSDQKYIQNILTSKNSSGSFVSDVSGSKSMISYVSSPVLDWKFIQITPYEIIMKKVNDLKFQTLLVVILILISGLLTSFFLSKRLYHPFAKIIKQLSVLESENRDNLNITKQDFLRSLFFSTSNSFFDSICDKFDKYNIKVNPSGEFILIVFKIDNFFTFCSNFDINDRRIYKFCILNIACELLSTHYINEGIDIEDDQVAVLMNISNNLDLNLSLINLTIQNIQESVQNHLKISVTCVVSKSFSTLQNLKTNFEEAVFISQYRLNFGHKSILYTNSFSKISSTDYVYPIEKEKLLVDSLMLGKYQVAKELFSELINNTRESSPSILSTTILRLSLGINSAIETLQANHNISIGYNFNQFISQLNRLETFYEITNLFNTIFDQLNFELESKKSSKYDNLVLSIKDIIALEFNNPNLTPDIIAEKVEMSSVYLSRLFKKLTSISLSDYINQIRLEKAKLLLSTSDLSVNQIMDQTGFISKGNFYSVFKKKLGLTPIEYRNKMKS